VISRDDPRVHELRIPHAGLGHVNLPSVHVQLALSRHVGPDQDDLVFLPAAIHPVLSGRDGRGGREAKLEGDATLGGGDGLPRAFSAEIDLIGRIARQVEPGSVHAGGGSRRGHGYFSMCEKGISFVRMG